MVRAGRGGAFAAVAVAAFVAILARTPLLPLGCTTRYVYVLASEDSTVPDDAGSDSVVGDAAGDAEVEAGCAACGDACVDFQSDPLNCGGCDLPCPPGLICDYGVCSKKDCPTGTVSCPDGTCVDLLVDPDHCSDCKTRCGVDSRGTPRKCIDAACQADCSKAPLASCVDGAECADLDTDSKNCGACFHSCDEGKQCAKGACIACAAPNVVCGTACVDLRSDPASCGACGKACPAGQACSAGHCGCPPTLKDCSGTCKDLLDDATACGACDASCATGLFCNAGTCGASCATGRTACGTLCVDATSDVSNCGACGSACSGATPYCVSSACGATPKCNAGPFRVLFYGAIGAAERAALPAGSIVTIATAAEWAKMSRFEFAAFDLVVIGEGGFGAPALWADADANKVVWSAAITGRILVSTIDPAHHPSIPAAMTFLRSALAWAAAGPGTGLYVAPDYGLRKLDFLSTFGDWDEVGQEDASGYLGDDVTIVVPTHPSMIGSTDASLSTWGYTYHAGLTKTPDGFVAVARGAPPPADAGTPPPTTIVAAKDAACVVK